MVPENYNWQSLLEKDAMRCLTITGMFWKNMGKEKGFARADFLPNRQNKFQDPSKFGA